MKYGAYCMQNIKLAEDKTKRVLEHMFFGHFVDELSRRWDDNVYLPKETGPLVSLELKSETMILFLHLLNGIAM